MDEAYGMGVVLVSPGGDGCCFGFSRCRSWVVAIFDGKQRFRLHSSHLHSSSSFSRYLGIAGGHPEFNSSEIVGRPRGNSLEMASVIGIGARFVGGELGIEPRNVSGIVHGISKQP